MGNEDSLRLVLTGDKVKDKENEEMAKGLMLENLKIKK